MKLIQYTDDILERLNTIRHLKKIGIEKISSYIDKDKSVTSRILNGKYSLDLITFINICYSLDENPVVVLNDCISPNNKIITISGEDVNKLADVMNLIQRLL